ASVVLENIQRLHVETVVAPAEHERLVDHTHLRPDGHHVEELRDVFREQADAAMTGAQAHAGRLVRAVNQIAGPLQIEGMSSERVVRTGTDHALQLFAVLAVLLEHGYRHGPGRVLLPPHDLRHALGRGPAYLADAD